MSCSLPIWDIAVQTEGKAGMNVRTYGEKITDPVRQLALAECAHEHSRRVLVRHDDAVRRCSMKTESAVIGFVADQHGRAIAQRLRAVQAALDQPAAQRRHQVDVAGMKGKTLAQDLFLLKPVARTQEVGLGAVKQHIELSLPN